MRFHFSAFLLVSFVLSAIAQSNIDPAPVDQLPSIHQTAGAKYRIEWQKTITIRNAEDEPIQVLNFSTAQYAASDGFLPRHYQGVDISGTENAISVSLANAIYQSLSDAEIIFLKNATIPQEIKIRSGIQYVKKQKKGSASFVPLRKNITTGKIEKLISYDLLVSSKDNDFINAKTSSTPLKLNSVLQSGKWYKIAVTKDGVYKISYALLKQLGIDPETINPKNIRVYGNGGGMLPKLNSAPRADDLLENAILVEGENDGVFNKEDYILFYGQSPHRWKYNASALPVFEHIPHLFSDSTYYFINVDLGAGKRISAQASSTLAVTHMVTSFDDYAVHENDDKNLINSGNQWFGEFYDNISSYDFPFDFPFIEATPVTVKVRMAGRRTDTTKSSVYSASCLSGSVSFQIPYVSHYTYAHIGSGAFQFNPSGPAFSVNVTKETAEAIAWLDYIEVHARRKLVMSGDQLLFRDQRSVGAGNIAGYSLVVNAPVQLWDVTDPANVHLQNSTAGNTAQFALPADTLKEFLAFTGQAFLTPGIVGAVENQNLHAIPNKDFVIVTHPDFLTEAQQLAAIHEKEDKLSTIVVTPQQIYNEFSCGAQDITAIRDFVRMFYNRANTVSELPKYLLLLGDGSYNNKKHTQGNTNYIPTYQSDTSTDLTTSFVSDDYYGMLDDKEGIFLPDSPEAIDIGIGRFPVKSRAEAQAAIKKIIQYIKTGMLPTTTNNGCSNNQSTPFGDWRNTICLVADDDDMNLHLQDAEALSDILTKSYKTFNQDKIYLDAFKQESTPGGERYPDVNAGIDKRIEKGCLIFNYSGHGGEVGLAHERVIDVSMINKWSNINNLPLFFTATCEFSRYDDPARTSAGEYVFLNPKGGAIALFTTVRVVYASFNSQLNQSFLNATFKPTGEAIRLGDIFQQMKSESINLNLNSRNFSLLGDPALRLTLPQYTIITDSVINGDTTNSSDTLKGLSLITIAGHLETNGTAMTNYNGVLYPTVFNKMQYYTTLSNNPPDPSSGTGSPAYTFPLQKNVLYKGKASVTNGRFRYAFIVPKDIGYQYGVGRISYYAENGKEDANGYYDKIIVGGLNDSAAKDQHGPEISLYMNDVKFISGGTTSENPDLFAILKDANGINTVGNGIGHDIIAILDANTDHSIVLNDYYQADLNSYQSGTIRYQLKDLPEGKHTLSLKVWDVYNNSSLATTEFVVSSSAELMLNHVLNYPNPFTTKTQFFFEHNQCCQLLNVQLQIFTISGKLVKNISKYVQAEGYRSDPIEWDGRDDFGDRIGRGVYIYRLRVRNSKGATAEKYEKLVIL